MWRAACLACFVACLTSSGKSDPPPSAGVYAITDDTCSFATPSTITITVNSDGSLSYAPCIGMDCTEQQLLLTDDGTGTFVHSTASVTSCGTDPQCGCQKGTLAWQHDKITSLGAGKLTLSLGTGTHTIVACSPYDTSDASLTWCDLHGVLQQGRF